MTRWVTVRYQIYHFEKPNTMTPMNDISKEQIANKVREFITSVNRYDLTTVELSELLDIPTWVFSKVITWQTGHPSIKRQSIAEKWWKDLKDISNNKVYIEGTSLHDLRDTDNPKVIPLTAPEESKPSDQQVKPREEVAQEYDKVEIADKVIGYIMDLVEDNYTAQDLGKFIGVEPWVFSNLKTWRTGLDPKDRKSVSKRWLPALQRVADGKIVRMGSTLQDEFGGEYHMTPTTNSHSPGGPQKDLVKKDLPPSEYTADMIKADYREKGEAYVRHQMKNFLVNRPIIEAVISNLKEGESGPEDDLKDLEEPKEESMLSSELLRLDQVQMEWAKVNTNYDRLNENGEMVLQAMNQILERMQSIEDRLISIQEKNEKIESDLIDLRHQEFTIGIIKKGE
jgi:hypothetical protein